MTRVSGLPEPRQQKPALFHRYKSHLWFLVKNLLALWRSKSMLKAAFWGEKSHLAPQWHRGLRVYVYIWSIGDSWSKRSMSGRVAWKQAKVREGEQAPSLQRNEWEVSAKPPIQAIMKECAFKMQSIRGSSWICAWNAWNCLPWLTAPLSNNYVKAAHKDEKCKPHFSFDLPDNTHQC